MKKIILLHLFCLGLIVSTFAQNVGLDNWFNKEISPKTGKPYHYMWSDSAWSGYSQWGKIFTGKGAKISHVDAPSEAALSSLQVYILVDPDTTTESKSPNYISPKDIAVIAQWVKKGGVLMVLANDYKNCEFKCLNQLMATFGMTFDYVSLHKVDKDKYDMGAFTALPQHPIFKDVKKIYLKEIASISLKKPVKAILTENGKTFMAESKYGKGLVIAVGDPWIYNEYIGHERLPADFENMKAAENLSNYLLSKAKKK